MLDRFKIEGKKALVTGASAGLGAVIAIALAEAGADVSCHGNSREPETTCEKIEQLGRRAFAVKGDLSKRQAPRGIFDETIKAFDQIDVLVNNAGTIRRAPAFDCSEEDWAHVLEVNLSSVFRLSQLVGRHMLEHGEGGKIINIASLLSFQGGINVAAYTASKSGVAGLTRALANEWGRYGINVNAIAPGYMHTDNTAALQADERRNRQILERIPAGRWGEPEDLAGAALFLASPASDYLHGTVMIVDGGWMGR
ncbi:MAG: 2-dehydro-3-deoxy-D-gluconate 5-dehydrogenase KduD [Pyrinomonadaceae bacterium]|nr:2-dehydro-3-deoxy-D-gluconate 5-dehydrogenase KduD [Pyrinomonadaceae bacterium]